MGGYDPTNASPGGPGGASAEAAPVTPEMPAQGSWPAPAPAAGALQAPGSWPPQGSWQAPGSWPPQGSWQAPAPAAGALQAPGSWPPQQQAPGWPAQPGRWNGPMPYQAPAWPIGTVTTHTWFAPPGPGPGLQWGGIGSRLGALLIDAVIIVCVLFGAGLLISSLDPSGSSADAQTPQSIAISLAWVFFAVTYHPVWWYVFGATPGQKSLGLRVAQASNGAHVGLSAVLVRYVIFAMATVVVPLGVISGVMASQDPFKRAWHDQVARTVVVKKV